MLLRRTLLYLPAQLVGPLAQFVTVVAWTHWLAPAAYGLVALALAAQELAYLAALAWWSHYTMRYYAALPDAAARARYQGVENGVLVASALVQAALLAALLSLAGEGPADLGFLAAAALHGAARSVTAHLAERARAEGAVGAYTLAQTAGPVLGFLLGWALVALGHATPAAVLAGLALGHLAALPPLWRALRLTRAPRVDRAVLRAALAYGLPLLVTGALGWASVNGLRVVVEHREGAAAVGLLSVGWALGHRLVSVAAMLVTAAAFPLAVRRRAEAGEGAGLAQLAAGGALLAGAVVPAAVGLALLAGPVTALLVGEAYRAATLAILPVAALSAGVRNLRVHFADQVFLLAERPGSLLRINAVEAAASLALGALGLALGGLPGACAGAAAGHALACALAFALAARRHGLALPWGDLARVGLAAGVMALALLPALRPGWPAGAPGLALAVALGASAYLAAAAWLFRGRLPPAAIAALRRRPA